MCETTDPPHVRYSTATLLTCEVQRAVQHHSMSLLVHSECRQQGRVGSQFRRTRRRLQRFDEDIFHTMKIKLVSKHKLRPSRSRIAKKLAQLLLPRRTEDSKEVSWNPLASEPGWRKVQTTETFGETMMLPSGSSSLIFIVDGANAVCSYPCAQRSIGTWTCDLTTRHWRTDSRRCWRQTHVAAERSVVDSTGFSL